jgi:hypothetical protein
MTRMPPPPPASYPTMTPATRPVVIAGVDTHKDLHVAGVIDTGETRKNYSGMAPITRASGTKRVVLTRYARNRRLADALYQQAVSVLTASPGARVYYDRQAPVAPPTTRPCGPWPTDWSASCTAASVTTPATTRPPPGTSQQIKPPPLDGLQPWDV